MTEPITATLRRWADEPPQESRFAPYTDAEIAEAWARASRDAQDAHDIATGQGQLGTGSYQLPDTRENLTALVAQRAAMSYATARNMGPDPRWRYHR